MPPRHLFEEWGRLHRDIERCSTLCLLFDFDGTLSPFAKKPQLASLPLRARRRLAALSSDPRVRLGVISGRSLADVRQMVGLSGIFYAGNHGLEVEGPGIAFVHPEAGKAQGQVKALANNLTRLLRPFRGVIVEEKGLTASVHYRLLDEGRVGPMLRAVEAEAGRHGGLVLRKGKKVVEIRPDLAWGKGKAAELIISGAGEGCLPLYVGDDETDEEAFASRMIHWTVRVMDEEVPTKARYFLRSVAEVHELLGMLLGRKSAAAP